MVNGTTKKIVVIRDIHSNFIEEAILILKNEPDSREKENTGKVARGRNEKSHDLLLKEAELIINSYIKENKTRLGLGTGPNERKGFLRNKLSMNIVINAILFGSMIFLIFLVMKLF